MVLTEDRERVKILLRDTITLLCKNGLEFKNTFSLEALIGVTLDDDDVFLMSINELVKSDNYVSPRPSDDDTDDTSDSGPRKRKRGRKRRRSCDERDVVKQGTPHGKCNLTSNTKQEQDEPAAMGQDDESDDENEQFDDDLLFVKQEVTDSWNSSEQRLEPSVTVGQHPSDPGSSNLADVNMMTAGNSQSVDWGQFASSSSGQFDSSMTSAIPGRFDPSNTSMSATQESQEGNQSFDHSQVSSSGMDELPTQTSEVIADVLSQYMMERVPRSYAEEKKVDVSWDEKEGSLIRVCRVGDCSYSTPHRSTMSRHQRRHDNAYTLCSICGKKFVDQSELNGHVEQAHDKKKLHCEYCGKEYSSRTGLAVHMKMHRTAEHEFVCEICERGYDRLCNYRNHLEKQHPDYEQSAEIKEAINEKYRAMRLLMRQRSKEKIRPCPEEGCSFSSPYRASIIRHQKRDHSKSYMMCPLCNNKFIENYDFRCHLEIAHGKHQIHCGNCGKKFLTKKGLQHHEESVCGKVKGLQVSQDGPKCDKIDKSQGDIQDDELERKDVKPYRVEENEYSTSIGVENRVVNANDIVDKHVDPTAELKKMQAEVAHSEIVNMEITV